MAGKGGGRGSGREPGGSLMQNRIAKYLTRPLGIETTHYSVQVSPGVEAPYCQREVHIRVPLCMNYDAYDFRCSIRLCDIDDDRSFNQHLAIVGLKLLADTGPDDAFYDRIVELISSLEKIIAAHACDRDIRD
jgi:hypothetical protein